VTCNGHDREPGSPTCPCTGRVATTQLEATMERLVDHRTLVGLVGLLGAVHAVLGLVALFWPAVTLTVLTVIVGVELVLAGVIRLVVAVASSSADARVLRIFLGLLSVIVGLVVIRSPLESLAVLVTIIGVFWIVWGLVEVLIALLPPAAGFRGPLLVEGGVAILGGIVLLAWPDATIGVLTRVVGLLLLLAGGITAWSAWRLRKAESTIVVTT
jgi:uncharacterized membrane protein HdeD (DUF308 family)